MAWNHLYCLLMGQTWTISIWCLLHHQKSRVAETFTLALELFIKAHSLSQKWGSYFGQLDIVVLFLGSLFLISHLLSLFAVIFVVFLSSMSFSSDAHNSCSFPCFSYYFSICSLCDWHLKLQIDHPCYVTCYCCCCCCYYFCLLVHFILKFCYF